MCTKSLRVTYRALLITLFSFASLLFAGCVTNQPASNANAPVANANANTTVPPTNTNSQPASSVADTTPVTMPVVDAMFVDESFANDIKSKVGLTDEQVDKIKQASR